MDIVSPVLFPVPPASYTAESFSGELLFVPRSLNPQTSLPEDFVPLLLLRYLGARFLLIFLHSNFEDLGRCRGFCRAMRDELGVHVLAAEYPAYGICPGGHCDERGATESASTAFRFASEVLRWPAERVLLVGRSVGTGPAVALALEHTVGGLVLISPFLSVREACRDHLGPVASFIDERFPNRDRMPYVRAPCLVVHGSRDTTIPARHGEQLYEICQTRKRLVTPNLDHNSSLLQCRDHFLSPMVEFFRLPQVGRDAQELQVPSWALERRFAPPPLPAPAKPPPPGQQRPSCLGCRGWPASCGHAGCSGSTCNQRMRAFGGTDAVEETIACAVEHILAGGRDDPWADEYGDSRLSGTALPVRPSDLPIRGPLAVAEVAPREPSLLTSDEEDPGLCDDGGPLPPHPTIRPHLTRMHVVLPSARYGSRACAERSRARTAALW
uniref:Serine aminopeptidase S33 domain-containing protein n=1 Tax=Alexandrium monilatum TaxID=311494 RepID=A0A7S4SD87_9DINO|mmetsp:Transcript_1007/g.3395  ORF Transcript_1007/g.3395 Transcript_1007/m.3395 type:complete len:441 (-) Transcript_1007:244-1566(-)